MSKFVPRGLGWWPDLPDPRDYTPQHELIIELLSTLKRAPRRLHSLPSAVDLRRDEDGEYFGSVENQGELNCSPVFAVLSLVEYFERRSLGQTFSGSHLFLYKQARKLRHLQGDTGIDLRTTLKALVRFGVPPEEFWPYQADKFDVDPLDPSLFAYACRYASIRYLRLDKPNTEGLDTLVTVRSFLAAGFPIAFGFPVPHSLTTETDIPYRSTFDSYRGGQAVVAVGYNDNRPTRGAILVRSAWGPNWGEKGYGWLPYAVVKQQLAVGFWTILCKEWLLSHEFAPPIARH